MWPDAANFLPHSVCLALSPALVWLHAVSDALIAISYYSIPMVLLVYARRRAEGRSRWVLILFAAFVLACGTTHFSSVVTLWWPIYVEQGMIKAITALISLSTAILLWPLLPVALRAPTHKELEAQVAERREAEAQLRELNAHLEARVRERTIELEEAKAMAEQANEAKSRFLASASHDLRQPFQAMQLFRDVLEARLTAEDDRHVLSALSNAMDSGRDLLNALLHISALEAGVTVPKADAVNLNDLLAGMAEEFRRQAEAQGLEFRLVPCEVTITTDSVLMSRMVRNLLTNALRYTSSGKVLIGCRRFADHVRLEVWDTGPGIPPERQVEIWEEFTQLDNGERDRSKGMGLGLAIVARTAKLLGLRIGVRSWVGKGSVFYVDIPLHPSKTLPTS
ncbi:MAG TPA: HAMP domain-containing sensor histidine kinase [Magnetospirillum sp.]|jgi:signal transduction histidine kinase|nr:HAMP domain-containing sensor histidine kinase [Magnetospirillum sp.]